MIPSTLSVNARLCSISFSDHLEDKYRFMPEDNCWTDPRALLPPWFCRCTGEQGLNSHETHDIFSGIVITCSHLITMLHLTHMISVNKKILFPLLLFLNLLPHCLWKVHNDDFFFFKSFPQDDHGGLSNLPKLRVVNIFWHPKSILPFPRRSWKIFIFYPTGKHKFLSVLSHYASFCRTCCYPWSPACGFCLLLAFQLKCVVLDLGQFQTHSWYLTR